MLTNQALPMKKPPLGPRFRVREADISGTGRASEERGRAWRRGRREERPFARSIIRSLDKLAMVGTWWEDGLVVAVQSRRRRRGRGGSEEVLEFVDICLGVISFRKGEFGVALSP